MEKLLLVGGGYDFAKLVHSVFGLYDFIIAGFFECKFNGNNIEFFIEEDAIFWIFKKNFKYI
ncbi:hypothetical protein OLS59_07125 [Campylobacter jejuni]|nr:hypothetical protein [Campylobacter jejuni]